tara:strand:- start:10564 stop:11454 length:891 start_codon:yes stop_codon:yes gene_type:complete
MRTIVLNRSNLVKDGDNNKLIYQFPGSVNFKKSYLALSQLSMYYSWYNISSIYNNNIIQYTWWSGAVQTTYTLTIPDGLYEVAKLNEFLQFAMIQNGHYLVNTTNENVYYLEMLVNPSRYAVQTNTFLFPTGLPAGWTNPAGVVFPAVEFNPEIIYPLSINEILGYVVNFTSDNNIGNAFVPPVGDDKVSKLANGTISYISTSAPDLQPNSSILVSISNIDNKYSQPSSIIYSIVPSVAIGGLINEKVPNFAWNKLIPGTYNNLRLTLLGTDLQPIKINDPAMTFLLVIKDDDDDT